MSRCTATYVDGRPRGDGAIVHRTFPIRDGDGRVVGHTCPCGRVCQEAGPEDGEEAGPPMTARTIRFSGHNRTGTTTTGRITLAQPSIAGWVEAKFDARWRDLEVVADDTGEVVGQINPHPDTGRRTWWAER